MQSESRTVPIDTGFIEVGGITHEGRRYDALGAKVEGDRLFAYVSESPAHNGGWRITTWNGDVLSTTVRTLNRWSRGGWFATYTYAIRFVYDGSVWSGITAGPGTYVKARRTKLASIYT